MFKKSDFLRRLFSRHPAEYERKCVSAMQISQYGFECYDVLIYPSVPGVPQKYSALILNNLKRQLRAINITTQLHVFSSYGSIPNLNIILIYVVFVVVQS